MNTLSTVSADEITSRLTVQVQGAYETGVLSEPVVWKPISDGLSGFTLTLPKYGVMEAVRYKDTAPLFYLSSVDDTGLVVVKDKNGSFDFALRSDQSMAHYRHPITPAMSLGVGVQFEEDETVPRLTGEYRSVLGQNSLQKHYMALSDSTPELMIARTELSSNERLEDIWSVSLTVDQTRMSYGRRWFDIIGTEGLLAEIALIDKHVVLGWQFEHKFHSTTGYFGSSTNAVSNKTTAFWGLKYDFGSGSTMRFESDLNLLSSAAQSLKLLRRSELPYLWRADMRFPES